LFIASCSFISPDLVLRVVNPSYVSIGGGDIRISFKLYNSGSELLSNCKVKWYVDYNIDGVIDYDEITVWAPSTGVDLSVGETSSVINVDTTSGNYVGAIDFYGIYEMGWDSPSND
jgi:hypothetical protein